MFRQEATALHGRSIMPVFLYQVQKKGLKMEPQLGLVACDLLMKLRSGGRPVIPVPRKKATNCFFFYQNEMKQTLDIFFSNKSISTMYMRRTYVTL